MQIPLSQRISQMQFSPIRKLRSLELSAQARGIYIYHLNIGQPDIKTPTVYWESIRNIEESIPNGVLSYGPSDGIAEYKQALAAYYRRHQISVEPENIIVTTAASEAIIFTLFAICDYGDEIIIPEPYYTNYNGFASISGVRIKPILTSIENGFSLPDMSEFSKIVTDKTKAILICNPNNPTGAYYNNETLDNLIDFCIKHNLYLISDEVYREYTYTEPPVSILQRKGIGTLGIVIDSLSKRYSACGARLGSICTYNSKLIEQIMKCAQTRLCPPTLEQLAAIAVVNTADNEVENMRIEYCKRIDTITEALAKEPDIVFTKPKGGFYFLLKLPITDAEDFARFLLNDYNLNGKTVMVTPADAFYHSADIGKNEIRIAAVLNSDDLKEALKILIAGLRKYQKEMQSQTRNPQFPHA